MSPKHKSGIKFKLFHFIVAINAEPTAIKMKFHQPVKKFVFFNPIVEIESVAILMVINNPVVIMFNFIRASNSTVLMELIIKHTETRAVEYSTGYFEGATLIDFFNITFHILKNINIYQRIGT